MKPLLPEYWFFMALAAGITAITIFQALPEWYLNMILLIIFFFVLMLSRTGQDRGFYLACSGEALVVACSITNIWAGLFALCMLAGIMSGVLGILESRQDFKNLAFFFGSSLIVALLVQVSNHVLSLLLVLGSIIILILAFQSVRTYQFRKYYTGT
ncbi:MAG: hypothetical protein CVV30_04330 [Methanomicrobiales archaeon HGW-Methanomicrobiales-1]|jgi:hypothetical protein|nr:MAG: hypothetical protein CVV30_04330 [Methanomicrobiales archaeon HGW-Methanomicrobiales-1]